MKKDDTIFDEWSSPLTIGLGCGLERPFSSVQYSTLYTIQLAKNWQFRLVPANWLACHLRLLQS